MSGRESLYARLPAIYRRRDAELGGPLRALLSVIDRQLETVRADIETTWDNAFVETAEEWLIPYLGGALGVPVARDVQAIAFSRRALVANTLGYRRRKGTAAMLEQLSRDLTNYPARVVEFFTRLAWNESINHPTGRHATLDLRSTVALQRLSGPFEEATRTVDVRSIHSGRGQHNLPNIGLFLWRTQLRALTAATAPSMGLVGQAAFRFNPFGVDRPLYAALETETDPAAIATEASVPLALSRRRLWERARQLGNQMKFPFSIAVHGLDGGSNPVVRAVSATQVAICDLSAIETNPATVAADQVVVDPELGRFVLGSDFTTGLSGIEVFTHHIIATAGQLGAGPWDRDDDAQAWLERFTAPPEARTLGFQVLVARRGSGPDVVPTLDQAVTRWHNYLNALPSDAARGRALGIILIGDSATHAPPAQVIRVPTGAVLGILGATWPEVPDAPGTRIKGEMVAEGVRPIVTGDLLFQGNATSVTNRGEVLLGGFALTGSVRVELGSLDRLRLASLSVLGAQAVRVNTTNGSNAALELTLEHTVVNGITAYQSIGNIILTDSAVTGALHAPKSPLEARGSTVLGACQSSRLSASNCIFVGAVLIEQHQEGCLRFSYYPRANSRVPPSFRCQPDLALEAAEGNTQLTTLVGLRMKPRFVSTDPHAPGFLLLDPECPPEIRTAAEDGGEPGCWHHLQHGIRLANLRNAIPQFLRFGMEPGIFFLV
ncbi:phage tail protein [Myxococcus stipitatus]|uniref:phage tail protein n=1 Tax=Myxococcus stipitatus TaxID=83455 RepID=UPI003144EAA4